MREVTEQAPLRIAVIGLGPRWSNHYRPLLEAPDCPIQVVSVFDPVPHRAQTEAGRLHSRAEVGLNAAIRRPDVEAVLVPDRSWFGAWPIAVALRAGRPVLSALSITELADELESRAAELEAATARLELDTAEPRDAVFGGLRRRLQLAAAELDQADGPRDLGAIRSVGFREIVEDENALNHGPRERLAHWLFELGGVGSGEEAPRLESQQVSPSRSGGFHFEGTLDRPDGPLRLRARLEPAASNSKRPRALRAWARAERGWVMMDHTGSVSWRDGRGRGAERVSLPPDAKTILQSFRSEARGGAPSSNRPRQLLNAVRQANQFIEQTRHATNQTAS